MATICLLLLLAPRPTVEETEAKANKALTSGDVATALLHFEQAIRLVEPPGEVRAQRTSFEDRWIAVPFRDASERVRGLLDAPLIQSQLAAREQEQEVVVREARG